MTGYSNPPYVPPYCRRGEVDRQTRAPDGGNLDSCLRRDDTKVYANDSDRDIGV